MTVIDRDGRVFGRFNLIDTAVAAFVVLLLPIGYATFLLFRPSRPVIDTVTRVEVSSEERRVSGAGLVIAKLKVKGSGFNPMLRASIDDIDAIALVFENPNSVDVVVGVVPPGKHDLVLRDGVQEVARARGAVEVQASEGPSVRAYGWLTGLEPQSAETLKAGFATDPAIAGAFRITAIGPVRPARVRVTLGTANADLTLPGKSERAAEVVVRCDWPSGLICTIDGQRLNQPPPIIVSLPGGLRFEINEIAPPEEPTRAVARIRVPSSDGMRVGDRDATVGARAAEITAIAGNTVTLALAVNESREGWRYRGGLVTAGSPFTLQTDGYTISGTINDVRIVRE